MRENFAQGTFTLRVGITIPANNGTIQTLKALLLAGTIDPNTPALLWSGGTANTIDNNFLAKVVGYRIHKYSPGTNSGGQRAAFLVGSGPNGTPTNGGYVAAGEDYIPPNVRGLDSDYPVSTNTSSISALVELVIMATAGAA